MNRAESPTRVALAESLEARARREQELVQLAFASLAAGAPSRHLAFQDIEDLDLDLNDPQQRQLGDYELKEKLGQGGMGVVYRAHQASLDREVAVKLLAAGPWASSEFVERFRREAQNAARLQHPNVVAIHEIASFQDLQFFTMRLVHGPSLAERLAHTGPLDPAAAARLMLTVAEAVDYAHRMGVLHLDLKPGNILLDEDGTPLVADFGLARRLDQSLGSDSTEVSGTPSYMAPEQATLRSHRLSPATDIWGLGAVLYELLTGEPPFRGPTPQATLEQVARHTVRSPRRLRPEISGDMEAICLACLTREPGERYASARALADDLQRFLDRRPVSVRPLNALQRLGAWARRDPRLAAASAIAVLALLTGLVAATLQWQRAEGHAREARGLLWAQRDEAVEASVGRRELTAALPVLVDNLAEQEAAGEHALAELTRVRIGMLLQQVPVLIDRFLLSSTPQSLVLDPDGRWLAVLDTLGRVHLFELPGAVLLWTTDVRETVGSVLEGGGRLVRSGDGHYLLIDVWHVPPLRTPEQYALRLVDGQMVERHAAPGAPAFLSQYTPDMRVALHASLVGSATLYTAVALESGTVLTGPAELPGLAQLLAPDGNSLALFLGNPGLGTAVGHRLEMRELDGFATRWAYAHQPDARASGAVFAPDGRTLAVGYDTGEVLLFDVASGATRELKPQAAGVVDLHFSDDGAWLVGAGDDGSIYVWDVGGGRLLVPPLHLGGRSVPLLGLVDARQGLLLAGAAGSNRLWHLAPGPDTTRRGEATLLLELPQHGPSVQALNVSLAPGPGLLASASNDGEVKLWRLRQPAEVLARPPPLSLPQPGALLESLAVDVEGRRVRLIDVRNGRMVGRPLDYPQVPSYVALRPGTHHVLATAGASLYGHDAGDAGPLFEPVVLEASPAAMLLSPRGETVVIAHQSRREPFNVTVLNSFDAADGTLLARRELRGAGHRLAFGRAGDSLLARRYGELRVLDARSLEPRIETIRFGIDVDAAMRQAWAQGRLSAAGLEGDRRGTPVRDAELGEDGRHLWLVAGIGDDYGYRLHRVDLRQGSVEEVSRVTRWPLAMRALDGGERVAVLLPYVNELRLYQRDGSYRGIDMPELGERAGLALSADGRWLAVGFGTGMIVLDAATGAPASPSIRLSLKDNTLAGMGFEREDATLRVWDAAGRTWSLPVQPDGRPVWELQSLAHAMAPGRGAVASASTSFLSRSTLAAADPGPPRHATAVHARVDIDFPGIDPRHVDLRPGCNLHPGHGPERMWWGFRLDALLPPGRHRLLGVVFELRCALLAEWVPGERASVAAGSRVEGVILPPRHARALHVLATGTTAFRDPDVEPYAILEVGYRDGSTARIPVLNRRHVLAHFWQLPDDAETRVAWAVQGGGGMVNATAQTPPLLFAARLENPHPERELATLAWESVERAWSTPLLLAVTLELVEDPPEALHPL